MVPCGGDEFRRGFRSVLTHRSTALEDGMTATYTFDVFSSLDGYGAASANWTGYWGKQGPELLDHRLALYGPEQRMVFGANTHLSRVKKSAGFGALALGR